MYKILQSTDWSFLMGREVEQIAIGLYQVQVHLSDDISISIGNDFVHEQNDALRPGTTSFHLKAASLANLLGHRVESIKAKAEESLALGFDDGQKLVILVGPDGEPYESFTVSRPGETIVV